MSPITLSRRVALTGMLGLFGCAAGMSTRGIHAVSQASDSWAGRLFGRSPSGLLVKRVTGMVPGRDEPPFFRGWQLGWQTWWPNASRAASHTEIYEDSSGEKIAVFRGMGQTDPRARSWSEQPRTASGVRELHPDRYRDRFRLFVLPEGSWVCGWGDVAVRLSAYYTDRTDSPPRTEPKPGAQLVQQLVSNDRFRSLSLTSTALYAADQIRGLTVATYMPSPAGELPVDLDVEYTSSKLASAAVDDLRRILKVTPVDDDDTMDRFFRRADIGTEGSALALRSVLPSEKLTAWLKA